MGDLGKINHQGHYALDVYRTANDPRTGNNPQIGPQMIPDPLTINIEWTLYTLYTYNYFS